MWHHSMTYAIWLINIMHWFLLMNAMQRDFLVKLEGKLLLNLIILYFNQHEFIFYMYFRGTEEYFNIKGRVDIINSTLGKALGGAAGGYTTGPKELIDLLKQRSRPYLFSNTLPPAVVASATKVIDLLMQSTEYPKRVQQNTKRFREQMISAGFKIAGMDHPICPIMLGDARLASTFADQMLSKLFKLMEFS